MMDDGWQRNISGQCQFTDGQTGPMATSPLSVNVLGIVTSVLLHIPE